VEVAGQTTESSFPSPLAGEGQGEGLMNKRTGFARNLRKQSTEAEKLLWKNLRAKQLEGFKFRRQQPIGNYIVDFVCFEKGLVVELDGGQHAVEKEKDMIRDQWLSAEGFRVLRFWNTEVLINITGVLERIRQNCLNTLP
jgi:very-short-patch-repair endonuclease